MAALYISLSDWLAKTEIEGIELSDAVNGIFNSLKSGIVKSRGRKQIEWFASDDREPLPLQSVLIPVTFWRELPEPDGVGYGRIHYSDRDKDYHLGAYCNWREMDFTITDERFADIPNKPDRVAYKGQARESYKFIEVEQASAQKLINHLLGKASHARGAPKGPRDPKERKLVERAFKLISDGKVNNAHAAAKMVADTRLTAEKYEQQVKRLNRHISAGLRHSQNSE